MENLTCCILKQPSMGGGTPQAAQWCKCLEDHEKLAERLDEDRTKGELKVGF